MTTATSQSACDSAFAALTVGARFSRTKYEQQRNLFEDASSTQNSKTFAAPTFDNNMMNNSNNSKTNSGSGASIIHAMVSSLPPPRLDFLTRELSDEDDENGAAASSSSRKNKNDNKQKNGNNRSNDDDDNNEEDDDGSTHVPLKEMGRKQVGNYLTKHDVDVRGTNLSQPGAVPVERILHHFSELVRPPLNVPREIVSNLFARQFSRPTVIQSLAMPLLLGKRNVLGCAPTGSGKTIAFLVPMFAHLREADPTSEGPRALIVAPTKELAAQIERETHFLAKGKPWRVVHFGHTTKGKDIFVTTPARALSMAESGDIVLKNVTYVVFDEGDKLWENAGSDFGGQVKSIMGHVTSQVDDDGSNKKKTKKKNQDDDDGDDQQQQQQNTKKDLVIAFFSATLPAKAEKLARAFMPDPVLIVIRGRTQANVNCDQKLIFTGNELGKVTQVRNMVAAGEMKPPVLIFVQTIDRSKELYDEVRAAGLRVALLHGQLSTEDRDAIVLKFRLGEIWVLITTELVARGIDFKDVATVINFDLPLTAESYIHRVGRTGRAGKRGTAVTFFTEDDKMRLPPIVKVVHESGSPVAPYLLDLKMPSQKQLRQLERSVPKRMIVSTRKRMRVGEDRIMRQASKFCRKEESDDDGDDGEGDFDDDAFDQDDDVEAPAPRGKKNKKIIKTAKRLPNRSAEFDDDDFE